MSVHRLPDGSTVFLCGRGNGKNSTSPEEMLYRSLEGEAAKQGRCRRCMGKVGVDCLAERSEACERKRPTLSAAMAILRGMVQG